jgi:hypothetical protein
MWQCLIGVTPLSISMFGGEVKNGELVISSKLLGSLWLCQHVVGRLKSTRYRWIRVDMQPVARIKERCAAARVRTPNTVMCYVRRNWARSPVGTVLWRDEERGARTRHCTAGRGASSVQRFDADCAPLATVVTIAPFRRRHASLRRRALHGSQRLSHTEPGRAVCGAASARARVQSRV